VLLEIAHRETDRLLERVVQRGAPGDGSIQLIQKPAHFGRRDRLEEPLLIAIGAVHGRAGHAGPVGNVVHRGFSHAIGGDALQSGIGQWRALCGRSHEFAAIIPAQ
jgi:hypothetical protein